MHIETAYLHGVFVHVGLVGIAVLRGPHQILDPELATVDDLVVARGHDVTVETSRHMLVGNHVWRTPTVRCGFGFKETDAKDVVDVAMREHRGVEGIARPSSEFLVHLGCRERRTGVDHDEAVLG